MKATETFQSAHILIDLEFFETDCAFGVVDTVFFCGFVGEDTCSAVGWGCGVAEDD